LFQNWLKTTKNRTMPRRTRPYKEVSQNCSKAKKNRTKKKTKKAFQKTHRLVGGSLPPRGPSSCATRKTKCSFTGGPVLSTEGDNGKHFPPKSKKTKTKAEYKIRLKCHQGEGRRKPGGEKKRRRKSPGKKERMSKPENKIVKKSHFKIG